MTTASASSSRSSRSSRSSNSSYSIDSNSQQQWQQQKHIWTLPGSTSLPCLNLMFSSLRSTWRKATSASLLVTRFPAEGVKRCCRTHTHQSDCTCFTCLTVALITARRESWAGWTDWCCSSVSRKHTLSVWKLSFCLVPNNSCNVRSQIINKRLGFWPERRSTMVINQSFEDRER